MWERQRWEDAENLPPVPRQLSITEISTPTLATEKGSSTQYSWKCRAGDIHDLLSFWYGALASVTGPHNLGFHPWFKEGRGSGHLEAFFTDCAPGRKREEGGTYSRRTTLRHYDSAETSTSQPIRVATLMPHRQGPSWAVGSQWRPPGGRADRRTASSPDTPHPTQAPFPGHSGLPRPHPGWAEPGATSRGPQLCLPWSSQPPPQTPGSGAETVKRPKTLLEPLWAQAGAADAKLADLRLAQPEAAPPELFESGSNRRRPRGAGQGRGRQNWKRAHARSHRRGLCRGRGVLGDSSGQSSRRGIHRLVGSSVLSALEKGSIG